MNITILSLLRVGDLLMQAPLLEALRRESPNHRITLVVNLGVERIAPLIPEVDEWIVFDRQGLQRSLGIAEYHLLRPVRDLQGWLLENFQRPADLLMNWTHTRLSAHLAAQIPAVTKLGLCAEENGYRPLNNRWHSYFNSRFSSGGVCRFHYTDLLRRAFDLPAPSVTAAIPRGSNVLLQTRTSERRKEVGADFWRFVIEGGRRARPDLTWSILGADFERVELKKNFPGEEPLILGWRELGLELQKTAMVLTMDTSIKHLAALCGVPTFEVGVPGVDGVRTGAYGVGHFRTLGEVGPADFLLAALKILDGQSPSTGISTSTVDRWGVTPATETSERDFWGIYLDGLASADRNLRMEPLPQGVEADLARCQRTLHQALECALQAARDGRSFVSESLRLRTELASLSAREEIVRDQFQELIFLSRDQRQGFPWLGAVAFELQEVARRLSARTELRRSTNRREQSDVGDGAVPERSPEAP